MPRNKGVHEKGLLQHCQGLCRLARGFRLAKLATSDQHALQARFSTNKLQFSQADETWLLGYVQNGKTFSELQGILAGPGSELAALQGASVRRW